MNFPLIFSPHTVARLWPALLTSTLLLPAVGVGESLEWTERELRVLTSLSLHAAGSPPADPSNRVADNPQAAAFGERLFFDPRLSGNGQLSCASCHQPERYFTDGLARSQGMASTLRNAPTVIASAWQTWFYWDGRRDSLWSQALIPIEAADEMGASRVEAVRLLGQDANYRERYESVFGAFPAALLSRVPAMRAGPFADAASQDRWHRLGRAQQQLVNQVYANLGKAIAAYERTLVPTPSRFDRYVAQLLGEAEPAPTPLLSRQEQLGARLFVDAGKTQCLQCHNGPMLSNGGFHNIGTGNFSGARMDFGRVFGLRAVLLDEFNCLGPYSDAEPEQCSELRFLNRDAHVPLEGAFKTPGLRNVSQTAPYFHDGRHETLMDVMQHYNKPPDQQLGPHELRALELDQQQLEALVAFMQTLDSARPRATGNTPN